jgi:hypothetical protein
VPKRQPPLQRSRLPARAQQEIPDAVEALVMRCLEKERERRWADVTAFLEALRGRMTSLTDAEIEAAGQKIVAAVTKATGAVLRG